MTPFKGVSEFRLTIRMGRLLSSPFELAGALKRVAAELEGGLSANGGVVRDLNSNVVGVYGFEESPRV